jgi:hypothetical protein
MLVFFMYNDPYFTNRRQYHWTAPAWNFLESNWLRVRAQGCQMIHFQTKISNSGKFWRVLQRKICMGIFYVQLVNFTAILYIFVAIWYILCIYFPFWYFVVRKIWQPWEGNENKLLRCSSWFSTLLLSIGDRVFDRLIYSFWAPGDRDADWRPVFNYKIDAFSIKPKNMQL